MPRYDQTIRQWTILKLLEANGSISLRRIADALEEPCHERTLRRDLDALGLSGFPIYTERVDKQTFWKLDASYRKFPLPLTATELYALHCGRKLMAPLEGTFIAESLKGLFQKANANLTPPHKAYLSLLHQILEIGLPPYKIYQANKSHIEQIREAMEKGKTVEMFYKPVRASRPEKKKINPYRLWFYEGTLYLIGYSHERREIRTYAVDRISGIKITDTRFQIPLFFSIEDYFKDSFGVFRGQPEPVELIFEAPASIWVGEKKWHTSQNMTPLKGKKIRMNFNLAVTPEFIRWVLGFGAEVEVIKPASLRRRVENEGWELLGKYQKIKSPSVKSTVLQNKKNKIL